MIDRLEQMEERIERIGRTDPMPKARAPSVTPFSREDRKALQTAIHAARISGHIDAAQCVMLCDLVEDRTMPGLPIGGHAHVIHDADPPKVVSQYNVQLSPLARVRKALFRVLIDHRISYRAQLSAEEVTRLADDLVTAEQEARKSRDWDTESPLSAESLTASPPDIEQLRSDAAAVHDRVGHTLRKHGGR